MSDERLTFLFMTDRFGDRFLRPWIAARPDADQFQSEPHSPQYTAYHVPSLDAAVDLEAFILAGPEVPTPDHRAIYRAARKRFERSLGMLGWQRAADDWLAG